MQIETTEKAAGTAPVIVTDTLHYPRAHKDVFVGMCVLAHNDRRV